MKRFAMIVLVGCQSAPAEEEDEPVGSSTGDVEMEPASESGDESGEVEAGPTYAQDIAPILARSCVPCHSGNGIAPFSIERYQDAAAFAPLLALTAEERTMPPWHADETEECEPPHAFKNDPRLSDDEIDLLAAWADAGAPEGDPDNAAPLPAPPQLDLVDPSGSYVMPTSVEVDGVDDQFYCYSIDPGLDAPVWITGLQLQPGNRKIVHHTLIYVDRAGASADVAGDDGIYECFGGAGIPEAQLLGGYVPGMLPTELPEGTGVELPPGGRLVLGFHFHPTGQGPEVDQSTLALRWVDTPPPQQAVFGLVGNFREAPNLLPGEADDGAPEFKIPAGASQHVELMEWTVPEAFDGGRLFSVAAHMHYIGVDLRMDLLRADGGSDCLLQTPRWDFDWQRLYFYDAPLSALPAVRGGDTVRIRCTYDNSLDNDALVGALAEQGLDEPVEVALGESTLEEMCLAALGVAY